MLFSIIIIIFHLLKNTNIQLLSLNSYNIIHLNQLNMLLCNFIIFLIFLTYISTNFAIDINFIEIEIAKRAINTQVKKGNLRVLLI